MQEPWHLRGHGADSQAADLTGLSDTNLYHYAATTNVAYNEVRQSAEIASAILGSVLTEQISRHLRQEHPTARFLNVRPAAEFHRDTDGSLSAGCHGHEPRLAAGSITNDEGQHLADVHPLCPIVFWLERLTEVHELRFASLDVSSRTWPPTKAEVTAAEKSFVSQAVLAACAVGRALFLISRRHHTSTDVAAGENNTATARFAR